MINDKTKEETYVLKKYKMYKAEEVIAAGGTTAFAKLSNYDPKKFYNLKGNPLSEEDFNAAIKMLRK